MTSFGFGAADGNASGTEFLTMLPPPGHDLDGYNKKLSYTQQSPLIPHIFKDAMSVREHVYGKQGVPTENEFDEDDRRSWHWVVYASVASTASSPPSNMRTDSPTTPADAKRKASASASRLPVGTIRLIPPPDAQSGDKHADAAPPPAKDPAKDVKKCPAEPYVKLGRLAVLDEFQRKGLSKLLIHTALEHAAKHPENIYHPPSPTTMELARSLGNAAQTAITWQGLIKIHAQTHLASFWKKYGFSELLTNEDGDVEISPEDKWDEEGIEHMAMWKRVKIEDRRL